MPLQEQIRLIEKDRDTLLDRIEQMVGAAENEEREFTDEEKKGYDDAKAQVDKLVVRLKTLTEALDYQKLRAREAPKELPQTDDPPPSDDKAKAAPKAAALALARTESPLAPG